MKDLFKDYNLPEELKKSKFVMSLYNQYKNKDLSLYQIDALNDILGIEEKLLNFKTKTVKSFYRNYFRYDYHGDALQDSEVVYDIDNNIDTNSKIQDLVALQYGVEDYILEYTFKENVEIPENTGKDFFKYINRFKIILNKIKNTKFRKIKSKNNHIRFINAILKNKDNDIIEHYYNKISYKRY